MSLAIRGGFVCDPANRVNGKRGVYVDAEGFVVAVGRAPRGFKARRTIDATNKIVCPGLIDLRARLREPGQEHKATLESELRAAVSGGITTLCCPPDTMPVIDTPAMAQMIQSRAWRFGYAFIHPLGALTRDLKGQHLADMEALDDAGCVAFTNAMTPVTDTLVMRRAMEYAASFDLVVFLHSQDPWLSANGCCHEGEISARLGLPGIPEAAETVAVARDLALIDQTRVRAHFCGLSSARAVQMVGEAQRRGLPVSADVTAHHLHLTEHDIGYFDTQCQVRALQRRRAGDFGPGNAAAAGSAAGSREAPDNVRGDRRGNVESGGYPGTRLRPAGCRRYRGHMHFRPPAALAIAAREYVFARTQHAVSRHRVRGPGHPYPGGRAGRLRIRKIEATGRAQRTRLSSGAGAWLTATCSLY